MTTDVQRVLDAFADLRDRITVDACFGAPVKTATETIIPVAKVRYAYGMGASQRSAAEGDHGEIGAAGPYGGKMSSVPLGVVTVTEDDMRLETVIDEQKVATLGMLVAAWTVFWLARVLIAFLGRRD